MTPYYDADGVTLYLGDCREVVPALGSEFAVVATDPPYGVGRDGWDDGAGAVDLAGWARDWLLAAPRAVFTWSALKVWTLGSDLAGVAEIHRVLVWHKPMVLNAGRAAWTYHWEPVVLIGRPGSKQPGRPFVRPDVISLNPPAFRTHPENVAHNSQKPLALMSYLIEPLTDPGVTVLDPFAGSGTTLVAAKALGRKAVGVEREERFCEIAAKRLAQGAFDFGEAS